MVRSAIDEWQLTGSTLGRYQTPTKGIIMTTEHTTDSNRQSGQKTQPGQQAQQDKSNGNRQAGQQNQPGQQGQHDKSAKDFDNKSENQNKSKDKEGKIATSNPGGGKSETKHP